MMADQAGKRMKMPKRPKTEKIHGKTVAVGTGVGEQRGKRVKPAIKTRREKQRELLNSLDD